MPNETQELAGFANALSDFIKQRKITVEKALRLQGRLLVQRLIKFTPPETYKQGRDRVRADVRKSAKLITPIAFRSEAIQKLVRRKKNTALSKVFGRFKSGKTKGAKSSAFNARHIGQHHTSRGKDGRVKRNLRSGGEVTPDVAKVNAYTRRIQENVGMAKGGWAKAFKMLGGRPAGWYNRHSSKGRFVDEAGHKTHPYLLIRNQSPWAGSRDAKRNVLRAIDSRRRDILVSMEKAYERQLTGKIRKGIKGLS